MEIYIVKRGDSVDSIAQNFQVPVESLLYDNQLSAPYRLAIGQALLIPTEPADPGRRAIRSGGYAYPYIEPMILEQTLPWLSDLYVFSYGFTREGTLLPPPMDDSFMIAMAKANNTHPVLSLTPLDENNAFNNMLIHDLLQNEAAIQALISNLVETVIQKGFEGVDLDFEYILADDRDSYVAFVRRVQEAINELGYETSVALAPKTSAAQRGLLYEGKDYPGLGAAADSVLLMTYEWGYT